MYKFLIFTLCFYFGGSAVSADAVAEKGLKKVGGVYKVDSIKRMETGEFRVEFLAEKKVGKFDKIILDSDHMHYSINEGKSYKISAEVFKISEDGTVEASQVLVFLPDKLRGRVPVWLLSRKRGALDFKSARYLDMHVPLNDYRIF